MTACPHCSTENEADFQYCDRCGEPLREGWRSFVRPRYDALARLCNGLRFLAHLVGAGGALVAVAVAVYFAGRSLLVALFFGGAAALASYIGLIALRAVSEFILLLIDMEEHLRDGKPAARRQ